MSGGGGVRPVQANVSGLFIRRPVMTTLVMAGILLFGLAMGSIMSAVAGTPPNSGTTRLAIALLYQSGGASP